MDRSEILNRTKQILQDGIKRRDDDYCAGGMECQFYPRTRAKSDLGLVHSSDENEPGREEFVANFCRRLFDATQNVENHFELLDQTYSDLFAFQISLQPDQTTLAVSQTVHDFLQRLPLQPLGLPGLSDLPSEYFDATLKENQHAAADDLVQDADSGTVLWPCLRVTSRYSSNILRVILLREIYQVRGTDGVEEKQLVDLTAELLHNCCKLERDDKAKDRTTLNRWLVVRCFLWASWQRAQMLYFYRVLYFRLLQGIDTDTGSLTVLRSTLVAPGLTIQQFADQISHEGQSPYMCSWAFNLLRTDGIAIGSDFRLLHMRYNQLLGHKSARCTRSSTESCDGSQMGNCQRFHMNVEDQSMHDRICPGYCPKLYWDEQSYRSVKGGRVVDASFNDKTDYDRRLLKYKAISERTLAISHAWAHGQGGRPSTGLNQCLHIRYLQLAKDHGCDGYFLDTACIPEDHTLRREAIKYINETFRRAKMTLIVDKDLLSVDISSMSIELKECILASILLSDWNVRAWTLLEAMKGRKNIHLLCRKAQSVSYRELILAVASQGRIDMAIFALLAPHLMSWAAATSRLEDSIGLTNASLEMAGNLLSYRPSSRLGDNIAIWSLMINQTDNLPKDAEEFWHNQYGKKVATGFLVSSAERLTKDGLTWAPKTPYAAPRDDSMPSEESGDNRASRRFFRAFSGESSEYACIDERGIFAKWCTFEFEGLSMENIPTLAVDTLKRLAIAKDQKRRKLEGQLDLIRMRYLSGYRYGAIAQPKKRNKQGSWSMHQHIAEYSGGVKGTLVVILGSKQSQWTSFSDSRPHELSNWVWRGVYDWPAEVDLPPFEEKLVWIS